MASWPLRRDSTYRDSSPSAASSPLTPLSPSTLPQWIRLKRTRAGLLSHGRLKVACIAIGCVFLGYIAVSSLGGAGEGFREYGDSAYEISGDGVLGDPNGFSMDSNGRAASDGVVAETSGPPEWVDARPEVDQKKPSVSDALSDLHHAVSDKIQALNPYKGTTQPPSSRKGDIATFAPSNRPNNTLTSPSGEDVKDGISEIDRLGARTRIGKCTIVFNGNSYWERAIRTHEDHDRIHGYRLHVLRQKLLDDVWDKPAYILSLLLRELAKPESERLEWLFWVDADTVIMNPNIPIETFLPPPGDEFSDIHLIYSADWNGLNNGIFPIRVHRWSVDLLSAIVAYRYYRPDDPLLFRDQTAMWTLMQEPKFAKSVVNAPQRWFNAYSGEHNETLAPFQVRRGDLLVHFAGVPEREKRMGVWLERAERHEEEWEVPLKSTIYPAEARDFWEEQRGVRAERQKEAAEKRVEAKDAVRDVGEDLENYGGRLTEEQREKVQEARDELDRLLGDDDWQDHIDQLDEGMKNLKEQSTPLETAKHDAHHSLLTSAHEAIFAGEKDLLDHHFDSANPAGPELARISDSVRALKNLVLAPQERWNRGEITAATEAVGEARGQLRGRLEKEAREREEQEEGRKMMEDVRKQIWKEAEEEGVGGGPVVGGAANAGEPKVRVVNNGGAGNGPAVGKQAEGAASSEAAAAAAAEVRSVESTTTFGGFAGKKAAKTGGGVFAEALSRLSSATVTSAADEAMATVVGHVVTVTPEPVMVWRTGTLAPTA